MDTPEQDDAIDTTEPAISEDYCRMEDDKSVEDDSGPTVIDTTEPAIDDAIQNETSIIDPNDPVIDGELQDETSIKNENDPAIDEEMQEETTQIDTHDPAIDHAMRDETSAKSINNPVISIKSRITTTLPITMSTYATPITIPSALTSKSTSSGTKLASDRQIQVVNTMLTITETHRMSEGIRHTLADTIQTVQHSQEPIETPMKFTILAPQKQQVIGSTSQSTPTSPTNCEFIV